MPKKPDGYWRNLSIDDQWFAERSAELTPELLDELVRLRGMPSGQKLLAALSSDLGYFAHDETGDPLGAWVIPLANIHGNTYAAKTWRNSGDKWLMAGWRQALDAEKRQEPAGRIFDLAWIVEHIDRRLGVGPWGAGQKGDGWLWICAGEWDCLMLRSFGWLATTAVFGESSKPQPELLMREFGGEETARTIMSSVRGVAVVFDVDTAGRTGAVQFVDSFERFISSISLPVSAGFAGVRAIDLRELPGWDAEAGGAGDEESGWDVRDLVIWGKREQVTISGALLAAASSAQIGVEAARTLLGVADDIGGRINLSDSMLGSSANRQLHTVEFADLMRAALTSAQYYGARGQGCYHMGLLASRNGWLLSELIDMDVEARLKVMFEREMPKEDELTISEIHGQISRSFLDFSRQDNLNTDRANVQRMQHYFPFFRRHPAHDFMHWNGVRWQPGMELFAEHVQRLPDYIAEESSAAYHAGRDETGIALKKWAKQSQQISRMRATVSWATKIPAFNLSDELGEKWDDDGMLLGTPIGVVEFESGNVLTGRSAMSKYCSMCTRGMILSDAEGHRLFGEDWFYCQKYWSELLHQWQRGEDCDDVIAMLQELGGLSMRGQHDELVILLQGSGRSGKSAFLQAMAYALGDYAYEVAGDVLVRAKGGGTSFKSASLMQMDKKRMLRVTEVGGKQLDMDVLKMITGEETVTGKLLYNNPGVADMHGTAWIMSNREVDLRGENSEALRNRFWKVLFNTTFVHSSRLSDSGYRAGVAAGAVMEAKDNIKGRLNGSFDGFSAMPSVVLTWMYNGLLRVLGRDGRWQVPESVVRATDAMWETSYVLGEYWALSGLWAPGGETVVATGWLWRNVKSWAENNDDPLLEQVGSVQKFAELLQTLAMRGFEKTRSYKALGSVGKQANAWKVPYTYIGPKVVVEN